MHWQHERCFGHATDLSETAVKAEKDMKQFNKKTVVVVFFFFSDPKQSQVSKTRLNKENIVSQCQSIIRYLITVDKCSLM